MMYVIFSVVLLLAGIAVVVVIHVCVVIWTIERFSSFAAAEEYRNFVKGLSAGELQKFPCYEYEGGENGRGSEPECVFCLDGFQAGDRCKQLPFCGHSFHAKCVDSWLMKNEICPICRRRVRESVRGLASGDHRRSSSRGGDGLERPEVGVVESGVPVALHDPAALA